jgi:hypothetical protein
LFPRVLRCGNILQKLYWNYASIWDMGGLFYQAWTAGPYQPDHSFNFYLYLFFILYYYLSIHLGTGTGKRVLWVCLQETLVLYTGGSATVFKGFWYCIQGFWYCVHRALLLCTGALLLFAVGSSTGFDSAFIVLIM